MANSITEAILLAGGLGTRLQGVVPNLPKCMAPVAGQPFINHVIGYLQQAGIQRFIFSLGYMGEQVEKHVRETYPQLETVFVTEATPLGTGGAIQWAGKQAISTDIAVVNGDTLFKVDFASLATLHHSKEAACTLALKPIQQSDRYGCVTVDATGRSTQFIEKKGQEPALINGGVYILNMPLFLQTPLAAPFSFEKDYLEAFYLQHKIYGQVQDAYFIDIGVPEDYARAEEELNDE